LNQNDTIGSIWPPSTMSKPLMGGGRTALVQKKKKMQVFWWLVFIRCIHCVTTDVAVLADS